MFSNSPGERRECLGNLMKMSSGSSTEYSANMQNTKRLTKCATASRGSRSHSDCASPPAAVRHHRALHFADVAEARRSATPKTGGCRT